MRHHRSGRVYLMEVLVALFAIGLLLSLLLPLMHVGRTESPRIVCMNNMRQCALSLMMVQENRRQYPGYANVAGGKRASWVVMILPQLERNDLYQNWQREDFPPGYWEKGYARAEHQLYSPMEVLVCPSAPRSDRTDPLSYVVNSGSAWTANDFRPPMAAPPTWVEDLASGVFFNRARADFNSAATQNNALPPLDAFSPKSGPIMTADYITEHDGLTYTMLLSENLQAGGWACDPGKPTFPLQSEFQMRAVTSFVWYVTGQQNNELPVSNSIARLKNFDPSLVGINRRSDLETPLPDRFSFVPTSNYGGLAAARPSANHGGGVNVAFCGGNSAYLSEDIDYRVLTQLMTPNGREVVVDIDGNGEPIRADAPAGSSPRVVTPWTYDLDESEF